LIALEKFNETTGGETPVIKNKLNFRRNEK
jgi:hypothetical protein